MPAHPEAPHHIWKAYHSLRLCARRAVIDAKEARAEGRRTKTQYLIDVALRCRRDARDLILNR